MFFETEYNCKLAEDFFFVGPFAAVSPLVEPIIKGKEKRKG